METGSLLIDTSIIIDHLRKIDPTNRSYYKIVDKYPLYVSTITLYELFCGATDEGKMRDIQNIREYIEELPFTNEIALKASQIYQTLRIENKMIDSKDLFIGATALFHDLPLMTLNVKHFERIEGLNLFAH